MVYRFLYLPFSSFLEPLPSCVESLPVVTPLIPKDEMRLKLKSDLCSLFSGWATIARFKSLP